MNRTRMTTIIRKEWAELYKNSLVLSTVVFMPLILTALPLVILWASGGFEGSVDVVVSELPPQMVQQCQGLSGAACNQIFIVSQFMLLFMMIPLIIPAAIAPYSIVGEKTQRSLEPLLASPITTTELLLAKNLAAVIPAILATWVSFGIFVVGARLLIHDTLAFNHLFAGRWLIAIFLLAPLLAILSVDLSIMVSSRSNDPRVAQQIASLLVLPVVFLLLGQMLGFLIFNNQVAILFSVVALGIDIVLTYVAVQVFDREAILTRWQ
ncbi:MAG: ABC transporter permease subunit [Chloroflexi bacterium]|nr:ABC transporter permease subunit [Chloroflexota bacterium]